MILVTGVCGQLGCDVVRELARRGRDVVGTDLLPPSSAPSDAPAAYLQMDITDGKAVERTIAETRPEAIIHCAAWTAVDAAEQAENLSRVRAVNVAGTEHLAQAARAVDAKLLYISTDYVFGGQGTRPWEPDDRCFAPLNVYGQSKLDGERAVAAALSRFFIVRTAWVFGCNGSNFVKTMIRAGKSHDTVRVVNDQIGTPTYTADLARLLSDMIETERFGYYHATNEGGYLSWYEFCCAFYRQYGLKTKVIPVTTEEFGRSGATRPLNSRLEKKKLIEAGFAPLPDWQDAVARYLKEAQL